MWVLFVQVSFLCSLARIHGDNSLPNIVFAMADDYGWGDTGYNNGSVLTPNLDAMARSQHSLQLQRYYSGGVVLIMCKSKSTNFYYYLRIILTNKNAFYVP
jgi:hypothetical protein